MPILDGVQATKEIRRAGLHVPIIAMTANALKGQAESYLVKGMTAYVAKPVDRDMLVRLLVSYLSRGGEGVQGDGRREVDGKGKGRDGEFRQRRIESESGVDDEVRQIGPDEDG